MIELTNITLSKSKKLDLMKLFYWFLCIYSVIFILSNTSKYLMIFGILCAFVVFLEKVLWVVFRGKDIFVIKNKIIKAINSIIIIYLGKYLSPIVASTIGILQWCFREESNSDCDIIILMCIMICSYFYLCKFYKNYD